VGNPDEVYNYPANPFVYNFLGNVNLFHGRIDEDKAYIHEAETGHVVYVRPHLLDIARLPSGGCLFRARIKHINSAGPLVKVEVIAEWGDPVRVEMPQERFRSLQLMKNEEVFIIPKDVTVFPRKEMARAR
jgi:sulfate transport system ATP-binding protein